MPTLLLRNLLGATLLVVALSACPGPEQTECTTAADCNDDNACTTDTCDANACKHEAVKVDDGNACTADACAPSSGVSHTPIAVDDGNACTVDSCDPATGVAHSDVEVDDGDPCTVDACEPNVGVTHTAVEVDDGNACTVDACDATNGITHTAVTVDDNDACTTDACDPTTGVSHTAVSVDDGNACTTDTCDPTTGVSHAAVDPDDSNACTADSCDPATGVANVAIDYDDNNVCTTDACDPTAGVSHVAVSVDDGNACTTDACDPTTGVSHVAVSVDDNDACTTDSCDPTTGVAHVAVNVDDNDACTTDTCNPSSGVAHTPVNIDDNNACTTDSCHPTTGVSHIAANIDDGNDCTADACDPSGGGVTHNPVQAGVTCNTNSGSVCDGAGACVQCLAATDCGTSTECVTFACNNNICSQQNAQAGTAIPSQTAGDCNVAQCDGNGGIQQVANDTDLPIDNLQCTSDVCTSGVASNPPAAAGTSCSQDGTMCNGAGACQFAVTVVHVGDGAAALTSAATPVQLQTRFLGANGVMFGTPLALPVAASGANASLVLSGTAASEGQLNRSIDGRFLVMAGYGTTPGTASITGSLGTAIKRVVARIDWMGNIDTTTTTEVAVSGSNPRGAATLDGSSIWMAGNGNPTTNGGVWYLPFGTTTATQVLATPNNMRWLYIYGAQLFGASGSAPYTNVFTIGSGLPTSGPNTATSFTGMPVTTGPSHYGFVVFDRDSAVPGVDTLYAADDRSLAGGGGLQKWVKDATGTWTLSKTLKNGITVGLRGLTGWVQGNNVILAGTTADSSANKLVFVVDDGSADPAFTVAAVAPTNTVFRGVSLPAVANNGLNETNVAGEADYCNIQFPASLAAPASTVAGTIYGQLYEAGLTDVAVGSAAPGVLASLGIGPDGTDPRSSAAWKFTPMTFNTETGNNDEYQGVLNAPATAGTYKYVVRFSLDAGANWTYCDLNGAGANTGLTFETTQLGTLTVTAP